MDNHRIVYTIEDTLEVFEEIGMTKSKSADKTIYTCETPYGSGYFKITKDITNYYFSEADYMISKGFENWYCISERYAAISVIEECDNISLKWQDKLRDSENEKGITFKLNIISGLKDWINAPPNTYFKGCSLIFREDFIMEKLSDTVIDKFGKDVDVFTIINNAGNLCLPTLTKIVLSLKNCNYTNKAYKMVLDAKVEETLAALIDSIENMNEKNIIYLSENDRGVINNAKCILEKKYATAITIKELSRDVAVNANKLQLGFKLLYGATVMEYLRGYRMEKSLELLAQNNTLSEVAQLVGYKSVNRFSETFYKKYGFTPTQYRKFL